MKRWFAVFVSGMLFTLLINVFIDFKPMMNWVLDRASYVAIMLLLFFIVSLFIFYKRRRIEDAVSEHLRNRVDYYSEPMMQALAQSSQSNHADALKAWAEFSSRVFNLIQLRFLSCSG